MPEGMDASAVAEPIESTGVDESIDSGLESGAEGEVSSETGNEVDSTAEKSDLTLKAGQKGKIDLAKVVKTQGEALKAIDPSLPNAIRTAAFEQAGLYREFPGGLKEAVGLKSKVSEYGGLEGIKEQAETVSEFGALARAFFEGKPDFVDNLIKESAEAFSQMMPDAVARWKATDADGYNHSQSKIFTATVDQFKMQDRIAKLWEIAEGPAKEDLAEMWRSLNSIRESAAKAPERKVEPKNEQLTRKEQELAQRETQLMLRPISDQGKAQIQSITEREMSMSYQWGGTDPSVKEAVLDRVRADVVGASKKDKGFMAEFERLKARGDSKGLGKLVENFQNRVTPQIVARVAKLFAVKSKGANVGAIKRPVSASGTTTAPVSTNWVRISAQPQFSEIDRAAMGRNYEDMILSNKAILKGGKRVMWA